MINRICFGDSGRMTIFLILYNGIRMSMWESFLAHVAVCCPRDYLLMWHPSLRDGYMILCCHLVPSIASAQLSWIRIAVALVSRDSNDSWWLNQRSNNVRIHAQMGRWRSHCHLYCRYKLWSQYSWGIFTEMGLNKNGSWSSQNLRICVNHLGRKLVIIHTAKSILMTHIWG
uniref:Uncharacterized protein n=1 Tax=Opuntia streptacantha TaxID=393608 RepID=A0A7C9DPV7_OPUST